MPSRLPQRKARTSDSEGDDTEQITPAQADTCPPEQVDLAEYRIHRKQVLSGLTREYYNAA